MKKQTEEKRCLNIIVEKFKVYDVDWLDFKITKKSPLTYHHIIPRREGGVTSIENGAPLTTLSHSYFHAIERKDYLISKKITRLFQELIENGVPADDEYFDNIKFYLDKYEKRKVRVYK